MKTLSVAICVRTVVGLIGAPARAGSPILMITEVVDGTLPGGQPKWVEISNCGIWSANLSSYSLGVMNNGSTTLGSGAAIQLNGTLGSGESYVLAFAPKGDSSFVDTYGFAPDQSMVSPSINGDDVLILFQGQATGDGSDATILDIYGVIGVDGTGEAWDHTDSYSSRKPNQSPMDTFDPAQWVLAGPDALETGDDSEEVVLLQTLTFPGVHDCDNAACPADLDGDGIVGTGDLEVLLANWGVCCVGDVNGDSQVGRSDLAIILAQWGTACDGGVSEGTIDHALVMIDNTAGNGDVSGFAGGVTDFTFDLQVTVTGTSDWTTSEVWVWGSPYALGQIYQHPLEQPESAPPNASKFTENPALEFDSYFCGATVIAPGGVGMTPVIIDWGDSTWQKDHELGALWADIDNSGAGTFTIARFTLRLNAEPANPIEIVDVFDTEGKVLLAVVVASSTHAATEAALVEFGFSLVVEPSPGDLTLDGVVDAADLATLLGVWGPTKDCPPFSVGDIDEDCDVDAADLAALLGEWG